jgi:hypothetical protein
MHGAAKPLTPFASGVVRLHLVRYTGSDVPPAIYIADRFA